MLSAWRPPSYLNPRTLRDPDVALSPWTSTSRLAAPWSQQTRQRNEAHEETATGYKGREEERDEAAILHRVLVRLNLTRSVIPV